MVTIQGSPSNTLTLPYIKVEFNFDTTMWNEGFEKADEPWLTIYTDNTNWVSQLPDEVNSDSNWRSGRDWNTFDRTLIVTASHVVVSKADFDNHYAELHAGDNPADGWRETYSDVFWGVGATDAVLDTATGKQLNEWRGI